MRSFHLTTNDLTQSQVESLALAIVTQGVLQGIQAYVDYVDDGALVVHLSSPEEERALAYEAAVRCAVLALRN